MKNAISETVLFDIVQAGKELELVNSLKNSCAFTNEEIKAIEIMIAYFRMLYYPKLKQAMKTVLSETLYKEFNKQ